ncbi:MAG: potassium-transporting ATPase subunit KdpA [Bdellovibrionales bacterium]|nr:potassium-transporting ATPase subunit KdpA [Bdellovibrionales bacterium]
MQTPDFVQLSLFILALVIFTPILGRFMAKVFDGQRTLLHPILGPVESAIYRISGVDRSEDMSWKRYAVSLMWFNILGIAVVFLFLRLQGFLPLNSSSLPGVGWHSALNTAVSFVTNTNWQGYAGETTMSYLSQMLALSVQNFLSAAVGMAVAIAFARGISRASSEGIGNFWTDVIRATTYILLPLSLLFAVVLIGEGVIQSFSPYVQVTTIEGGSQTLPMGPAASQVAIKQLGTNGGGFFNANSAHPFENPTPLSNFLEILAIFLIPAALTFTFGSIVRSRKHGWIIFGSMLMMFLAVLTVSLVAEFSSNPTLAQSTVMEGKEVRFGTFGSTLFAMVTTAASCGAVNALHSSLSPLTGAMTLLNMMVGEVIFGGVGAGLYGMLLFVIMTVFLAGLMVGRTPEYLGKRIEAREMTLVILAILAPSAMILIGTGISVVSPVALSSLANTGPHGFSEVLYAFTSASANNGSAFAGLNANTTYYNLMLSIAMFVGRFAVIIPALGIAGSLARKKYTPPSPGTFKVDTVLFGVLLIGIILIVGGLTFFPALVLGPVVEHLLMLQGRSF